MISSPSAGTGADAQDAGEYRAGFVSVIGRPNVGKSTLTNALVGEKVAITSSKPQTTRRTIRGIISTVRGQLILVDTPGVHRPRTLLGERLNRLVISTLGDVDVIALCIPGNEPVGKGDRFINSEMDKYPHAAKAIIITKIDQVSKEKLAKQLQSVSNLRDWDLIIPVSALHGEQLSVLITELIKLLPKSDHAFYLNAETTDEEIESRVAELIREATLEGANDELPHSIMVTVDEINHRSSDSITDIFANIFVERDSQKGIIIGKNGARLREIGSDARLEIEELLGVKVFLSLRVRVAKDWQRDPKQLGRLGF